MAFEETERGARPERALARLRPRRARSRTSKLVVDYVHVERERDRGDRRVRPRGAVHPPGATPSTRSAPSASCSTPSRRSSAGCPTRRILRAELRRLFRWLKDKGVTAVITAERGDGHADPPGPGGVRLRLRDPARPPRHTSRSRPAGCASSSTAARAHGTNEYPFLIDEDGITVLPHHLAGLEHEASDERVSSGVAAPRRHARRRRAITAAAASSSRARRAPARPASRRISPTPPAARGERVPVLRLRGVARARSSATCARSAWTCEPLDQDRACCASTPRGRRSTAWRCTWPPCTGWCDEFEPQVVVVDPISNLLAAGTTRRRAGDAAAPDRLPQGTGRSPPSSRTSRRRRRDAWSRPTSASPRSSTPGSCCATSSWAASATAGCTSSSRAAWRTPTRSASSCSPTDGIELLDVYVGPEGVLTGSMRAAQEAREKAAAAGAASEEVARKQRELERRRARAGGADRGAARRVRGGRGGGRSDVAEQDRTRRAASCANRQKRRERHAPRRRSTATNGIAAMNTRENGSPVELGEVGAAPVHGRPDAQVAWRRSTT